MPQQVLIALALGVATGLFFGEYAAGLKIIGDVYIGLLQMMVLPYIVLSLVGGIGKLTLEQARLLAKYAVLVLLLMWAVIATVLLVLPLALPELLSASFFSSSLVEPPAPVALIEIFVPDNVFDSLSSNHVPAVVVFCIALGIALIGTKNKRELIRVLDVVSAAVMRVIRFVVALTPLGVFVMTASAAGTLSFEDLGRLQGYFILYAAAVSILGFLMLPGLIASLTPFRYRDVIGIAWSAMILAFAASKTLVAVPLVIEGLKDLFARYQIEDENSVVVAEMLVPVAYAFPNTGKLLGLFFVPFTAWFLGTPLGFRDYALFLPSGLLSFFGSPAVAMPFLLDLMHMPADMFQIFILTGVLCARLSDALGAMDMFTFAALVACLSCGLIRVRWPRLLLTLAVVSTSFVLVIVGVRAWIGHASEGVYRKDEVVRSMQLLEPRVSQTVVEPEPNPSVLRQGQSHLDRIRERGVVRVGFDRDRLPFSYFNGSGDLVGFDIDMAHVLAQDLGVTVEFVPFEFGSLVRSIEADHFDIAMAGVYGTTAKSELIRFSEPYLYATMALVVPDHRRGEFVDEDSFRAIDRVRVGVHHSLEEEGGNLVRLAEREFPNMEVTVLESYRDFYEQSGPGEGLDALFTGAENGSAWTLLYPDYQVATPFGGEIEFPLVYPYASSRDSEMDEFIDHWVALKQHDGTVQDAYEYWILGVGSETREPRWSVIRDVLGWVD
jgi:proton glutamate symport protein